MLLRIALVILLLIPYGFSHAAEPKLYAPPPIAAPVPILQPMAPSFDMSQDATGGAYDEILNILEYARRPFEELQQWDLDRDGALTISDVATVAEQLTAGASSLAHDLNGDGQVNDADVMGLHLLIGDSDGWGLLDFNHDGRVDPSDYAINLTDPELLSLFFTDPDAAIAQGVRLQLTLSSGENPVILGLPGIEETPTWRMELHSPTLALVDVGEKAVAGLANSAIPRTEEDAAFLENVTKVWKLTNNPEAQGERLALQRIVIDDINSFQQLRIETTDYAALNPSDAVLLPHYLWRDGGTGLMLRSGLSPDKTAKVFSLLDLLIPQAVAANSPTLLQALLAPDQRAVLRETATNTVAIIKRLDELMHEWDEMSKKCKEMECADLDRLLKLIAPVMEAANASRLLSRGMVRRHEQMVENLGGANRAIARGVEKQARVVFIQSALMMASDVVILDWQGLSENAGTVLGNKAVKLLLGKGSRYAAGSVGGEGAALKAGFAADVTNLLTNYKIDKESKLISLPKFKANAAGSTKWHASTRVGLAFLMAAVKYQGTKSVNRQKAVLANLKNVLAKALSDHQQFQLLEDTYSGFELLALRLYRRLVAVESRFEAMAQRCRVTKRTNKCSTQLEQAISQAEQQHDDAVQAKRDTVQRLKQELDQGFSDSEYRLTDIRTAHQALSRQRNKAAKASRKDSERTFIENQIANINADIAGYKEQKRTTGIDSSSTIAFLANKRIELQAKQKRLAAESAGSTEQQKLKQMRGQLKKLWQAQDQWQTRRAGITKELADTRKALRKKLQEADLRYNSAIHAARKAFDACLRRAINVVRTKASSGRDRTKDVVAKAPGGLLTTEDIFSGLMLTQRQALSELQSFKFIYNKLPGCKVPTKPKPAEKPKHLEGLSGCWHGPGSGWVSVLQQGDEVQMRIDESGYTDQINGTRYSGRFEGSQLTLFHRIESYEEMEMFGVSYGEHADFAKVRAADIRSQWNLMIAPVNKDAKKGASGYPDVTDFGFISGRDDPLWTLSGAYYHYTHYLTQWVENTGPEGAGVLREAIVDWRKGPPKNIPQDAYGIVPDNRNYTWQRSNRNVITLGATPYEIPDDGGVVMVMDQKLEKTISKVTAGSRVGVRATIPGGCPTVPDYAQVYFTTDIADGIDVFFATLTETGPNTGVYESAVSGIPIPDPVLPDLDSKLWVQLHDFGYSVEGKKSVSLTLIPQEPRVRPADKEVAQRALMQKRELARISQELAGEAPYIEERADLKRHARMYLNDADKLETFMRQNRY